MINFGWEYVWHCHILGHEENDMMRAMILAVAPSVPTASAASLATGTITLTLSTAANTPNVADPTGFSIYRGTRDGRTVHARRERAGDHHAGARRRPGRSRTRA